MTAPSPRRDSRPMPLPVLGVLALLAGSLLLGACNTAAGFGRDMESAGNWIEESVENE